MELTVSDEVIHTEGWSRASLDRLIQKIDAHGDTTDRHPGSGRPRSVKTTDNIAVVQDLICSQATHPTPLFYVAPPIVVHFNYVKFAAEYLL